MNGLKKNSQKLENKTKILSKLQKLSEILSGCQDNKELAEIVSLATQSILPSCSGGLSITHASMDKNEVIVSWGTDWTGEQYYAPNQCWSFRQGSAYNSSSDELELKCEHLHSELSTLCIPLLAHGKAIGAFHIINNTITSEMEVHSTTIADNLSLALANINLNDSLKRQAIRDPLTNLYNRRYLDEAFYKEILRAKRQDYDIGVLMIDIDHFKQFNDSFGHGCRGFCFKESKHYFV